MDPRAVGSPALVASMLEACGTIGKRQGPRFRAFYGCMFYALMRPSEVAALTREGCHLPDDRLGPPDLRGRQPRSREGLHRRRPGPRAPRPQRPDQGQAHPEGPQARAEGPDPARARRAPPHAHRDSSAWPRTGGCSGPRTGNPLQPSTWWQVWQKVRAASLTPEQLASPLMKRPYDLRHSGVTWRLNSGVPATEVAAWAGHSVEMLMRDLRAVRGQASRTSGSAAWTKPCTRRRTDDSGPRMGRRIRQMTASGGATCPSADNRTFQRNRRSRPRKPRSRRGAPSRIRTCAPGSGGRCSIP